MDKIWDRKSFEVGGHWPLWQGWKKEKKETNSINRPTSLVVLKRTPLMCHHHSELCITVLYLRKCTLITQHQVPTFETFSNAIANIMIRSSTYYTFSWELHVSQLATISSGRHYLKSKSVHRDLFIHIVHYYVAFY